MHVHAWWFMKMPAACCKTNLNPVQKSGIRIEASMQ